MQICAMSFYLFPVSLISPFPSFPFFISLFPHFPHSRVAFLCFPISFIPVFPAIHAMNRRYFGLPTSIPLPMA